jgi:alkylation response protein AidB-like acyl-CoA dehydrogenase
LGLARRVIEDVKALVAEKVERPSGRPYRELDRVRTAIGNAEMLLGAARSYVFSSLELQWRKIETNEPLSKKERADVWLSRLNAFQASRAIVRDLYDVIGGSAIYEGRSILDRALRDAETMCQHVVGQRRELAKIGGLLLNDPREDRNMLVPR